MIDDDGGKKDDEIGINVYLFISVAKFDFSDLSLSYNLHTC